MILGKKFFAMILTIFTAATVIFGMRVFSYGATQTELLDAATTWDSTFTTQKTSMRFTSETLNADGQRVKYSEGYYNPDGSVPEATTTIITDGDPTKGQTVIREKCEPLEGVESVCYKKTDAYGETGILNSSTENWEPTQGNEFLQLGAGLTLAEYVNTLTAGGRETLIPTKYSINKENDNRYIINDTIHTPEGPVNVIHTVTLTDTTLESVSHYTGTINNTLIKTYEITNQNIPYNK